MRKQILSLSLAVCMLCLLTMTSCSAADLPAAGSGRIMRPSLWPHRRLVLPMFPRTPGMPTAWPIVRPTVLWKAPEQQPSHRRAR